MGQISEKTISDLTNSSDVVKHLFIAELRRIDNKLLDMVKRNNRLNNTDGHVGFLYQGEYYLMPGAKRPPMHGERGVLHPELWNDMSVYLKACARLLGDCTMVNQMIFRLVQGCKSRQDVRDALPEAVVVQDKLLGLNEFPRTRPTAYTLEGDERAKRQYKKVEPIMLYYAGSHLLL